VLYFVQEGAANANRPPVANAGSDQSIPVPVRVTLNGTASYDPDGSITNYSWTQISGPGTVSIADNGTAKPRVTGLQTGAYLFELVVTDDKNATARDTVQVTVATPAQHSSPEIIKVYPNPVVNTLTIDVENGQTGNLSVALYDVHGRAVLQKLYNKEGDTWLQTLDVHALARGAYQLRLRFGGQQEAKSITVVKL